MIENGYIDVTYNWINDVKVNSHNVKDSIYYENFDGVKYYVDGKNVVLDYTFKEKEIALWLENTFGGELYMLPRVNNPDGIMTADYLFRGEYWDLKQIFGNGKHTFDSSIKKKKSQANNFIFDVCNRNIEVNNIENQIRKIYCSKERFWVDKIIIKRDEELLFVYERIKK